MLYQHFVAIKSVYSRGIRIAWHYSDVAFDNKKVQTFLKRFKAEHGDLQLGIHRIVTDSLSWESVVDSDDYFRTAIPFGKETDFLRVSTYDKTVNPIDIAKLILTVKPVTQLKLQKLVYFAYEEFLKKTGEKLFSEPILAWKHGPVVKSLYDEFRDFGSQTIAYEEDEDDITIMSTQEISVKPTIMRILSAEHGEEIIKSVYSTISKYGEMGAWDLVEETHRKGSPWEKVYKKDANQTITDEVILSC